MKNNKPLVSVIIPAYNVEAYLDKCMQSLLNQTYSKIEIILVDDGSIDKTAMMCEQYAEADTRVKVYHQVNSGQAVARNFAYTVSKGEYILYADSDDWLDLRQIEVLMGQVLTAGADIVQCYAQKFWDDGKQEKIDTSSLKVETYTASEALEEFCYQRKFYAAPWAKVIRRELLDGLQYPPNTGYEDMAIMYRLLGRAKKIILVPEVLYFYRQHKASTMHTNFSDKKVDRIRIAEQFKTYIEKNFPELSTAVKTRYLLANLQLLMDLPFSKEYRDLQVCVKKNIKSARKTVIFDKKSKLSLRGMAVFSYLGMPVLMLLGRMYKKIYS